MNIVNWINNKTYKNSYLLKKLIFIQTHKIISFRRNVSITKKNKKNNNNNSLSNNLNKENNFIEKNSNIKKKKKKNIENILRPYQEECVNKCISFFKKGIKRQLVSLPVGSGKTVVFAHLIKKILKLKKNSSKILVLAHREELINQAWHIIKQINPNLKVGIERGDINTNPDVVDIIIASVPTIGRQDNFRIQKYDPKKIKCIIIDEAHHSTAPTYLRILDYFGARDDNSPIFLWGCSATLYRHDGIGLEHVFQEVTYHKDFVELMNEQWLCSLRAVKVTTNENLNNVSIQDGDFSLNHLTKTVNTPNRNKIIVNAWKQYSENRKSTLIFAVSVQHIYDLLQTFHQEGINAKGVHGETPKDERAMILEDFKNQKISVLINCGIFTEGVDIPNIDCIVMARPTLSSVLFHQMIGRGLRNFPNKKDCLVIDIVDNLSNNTLITTPSIFGLHPSFNAKGADIIETYNEVQMALASNPKIINCKTIEEVRKLQVNIHELDILTPEPLLKEEDIKIDQEIKSYSPLNWIRVGEGKYIISLGSIKVEAEIDIIETTRRKQLISLLNDPNLDIQMNKLKFSPSLFSKLNNKKSNFIARIGYQGQSKKRIIIAQDNNLHNLFEKINKYLQDNFPQLISTLKRNAEWRSHNPTLSQVQALLNNGFEIKVEKDGISYSYNEKPLTKGLATFLIEKKYIQSLNEEEKNWTNFSWIKVVNQKGETQKYILPLRLNEDFCYIQIIQDILGKFRASVISRKNRGKSKTMPLVFDKTLKETIEDADNYIKLNYPNKLPLLQRNAEWHNEPASKKQIDYLSLLLGYPYTKPLTKGDAKQMIDNLLKKQQQKIK